jgi:bacteriorhodopsin
MSAQRAVDALALSLQHEVDMQAAALSPAFYSARHCAVLLLAAMLFALN